MESNSKHDCPNRCDLEFTYDWQHTNLNASLIKGNIDYFLNGGDEISIEVDKIEPQSVYVLFNGNTQELTSNNNIWSGTIPSEWNSQGVFSVIAEYNGCRVLLYQGLLNNSSTLSNLDYLIYSSNKTINATLNQDGSYNLTLNEYEVEDEYNYDGENLEITNDELLKAMNNNVRTIIFKSLNNKALYFYLDMIKDKEVEYFNFSSLNTFLLVKDENDKITLRSIE